MAGISNILPSLALREYRQRVESLDALTMAQHGDSLLHSWSSG